MHQRPAGTAWSQPQASPQRHPLLHKVAKHVLVQPVARQLARRAVGGGHDDASLCQQRLEQPLERHRRKYVRYLARWLVVAVSGGEAVVSSGERWCAVGGGGGEWW